MIMKQDKQISDQGFTLIELCIVLMVFALTTGIVMYGFQTYTKQKAAGDTAQNIEDLESALLEYRDRNGGYPCPADPTLTMGMPGYGREVRTVPVTDPNYFNSPCVVNPPNVVSVQAIRDFDNADNDNNINTGIDAVLIGAVPVMTLMDPDGNPQTADGVIDAAVADNAGFDGWGNKLRYAVSESLTRANNPNDLSGAIDLVDESGASILAPGPYAHTALISGGPNGRGFYSRDGRMVQQCTQGFTTPTDPVELALRTNRNETENCSDDNGIFLAGLKIDKDHSYNDDYVKFMMNRSSALWEAMDSNLSQIRNVNVGNVGLGTIAPRERLTVAGNIVATSIHAAMYTDPNGNMELAAEVFGGDGVTPNTPSSAMQCPAGRVVTRIENNRVVCIPAFTNTPAQDCNIAQGEYLQGFSSLNGTVTRICCRPNANAFGPANCGTAPIATGGTGPLPTVTRRRR
jgi:prepilin-type N-terminal cleavage/methylation domain-containing protein